ncbi:MAG: hypothetical protein KDB61_06000, partial [Planctomycetes bacterium]|nr:hypothetical protein [Planctomycetota bacterium]
MQFAPFPRRLLGLIALCILCAGSLHAQLQVRVACVGDSITEGNANPDWELNSWPQILQRLLDSHAPGAFEVGNFGRSGATLMDAGRKPYRQQDVYGKGLAFLPHKVIINLGTNDATDASWTGDVADFERDLRGLIAEYRALESAPEIWLSRLTPMFAPHPRLEECKPRRVQIEACIDGVANELGLPVLDWNTPLLGERRLFPDGLHPNTAGNEIMARAVMEAWFGVEDARDPSLRPRGLTFDPEKAAHIVRAGKMERGAGTD